MQIVFSVLGLGIFVMDGAATQATQISSPLWRTIVAARIPAIVTGLMAYVLARRHDGIERAQYVRQARSVAQGQIATLRQTYISPLRYWASIYRKRIKELQKKHQMGNYEEVSDWFLKVKSHADASNIISTFPSWSSYQGIFAITTLYWTCQYLKAARDVTYGSPFNEINQAYDKLLHDHLTKVSEALGSAEGIWDSAQEVLAEAVASQPKPWTYQSLCRVLDGHNSFEIAPLLRPLDYYRDLFKLPQSIAIGQALDGLITFLDSQPTPEFSSSE